MILDIHPMLQSAFVALVLFPLLLTGYFLSVGRSHRRQALTHISVANRPAKDFLSEVDSKDKSFGEYLEETYNSLQTVDNYLLPLAIFMLPYVVGLYWATVAIAYMMEPSSTRWTDHESVLSASQVPLMGFLGGVASALWHMGSRIIRNDVSPRMFNHQALRLVVAPVFAVVIAAVPALAAGDAAPVLVLALLSGFFPSVTFRFVTDWFSDKLGGVAKSATETLSLRRIQGIEREEELRLWEEGIVDAEHLAAESVVYLLVSTNYSLERIIDWKDQAFLYVYAPEDLEKLRAFNTRGIMDVLGLDASYLGEDRAQPLRKAFAENLGKPEPVIERFVDTIFNDPRVHQLWEFLVQSHPTKVAEPIAKRLEEAQKRKGGDPEPGPLERDPPGPGPSD